MNKSLFTKIAALSIGIGIATTAVSPVKAKAEFQSLGGDSDMRTMCSMIPKFCIYDSNISMSQPKGVLVGYPSDLGGLDREINGVNYRIAFMASGFPTRGFLLYYAGQCQNSHTPPANSQPYIQDIGYLPRLAGWDGQHVWSSPPNTDPDTFLWSSYFYDDPDPAKGPTCVTSAPPGQSYQGTGYPAIIIQTVTLKPPFHQ